ncbi:MAG: sialidase family protein [Anaerolineae bacterium]
MIRFRNLPVMFMVAGILLSVAAPLQAIAAPLTPAPPLPHAALAPRALVAGTLLNLNKDAASQHDPAILRTTGGDLVVAYEQDVLTGSTLAPDIFVTHSTDGITYAPPINLSHTRLKSRTPALFRTNGNAYLLYLETLPKTTIYQMFGSVSNSGSWSTPTRVTTNLNANIIDPAGVQASDGTNWVVGQIYLGGTWTDTWVQPIGGAGVNLSADGSAVRHPAIAAGDNGQVYVAWIDHANEYGHPKRGINVLQWNGATWARLPIPSTETAIQWVNLSYYQSKLYLTWPSGISPAGIRQVIWDGAAWGPVTLLATGSAITYLHTAISPAGNIYVSWVINGVVYLKRNGETPIVLSQGLASAKQPALFVDDNDVAYVAFQQNYDIWLNTAQ